MPNKINASLMLNRWWSITAFVASLGLLAVAHAFQRFLGLDPCHLCIKQRDIYWIAVGVSGVASIWALFTGAKGPPRVFSFLLFAIFLTGAGIALYHTGAEQHWWLGPQSCTTSNKVVGPDQIAAMLSGESQIKPPQCNVVAWQMFGISMAGYNAILSSLLAILSLLASMRINILSRKVAAKPSQTAV